MTTIQIAYEVSDDAVSKIEALLEKTALWDANWNGAVFKIERGDCTCFPDDGSLAGVSLLNKIFDIVDGVDA